MDVELEDGRKADYDTHCTVGVVTSFLPKRKFQGLAEPTLMVGGTVANLGFMDATVFVGGIYAFLN